MVGLKGVLILVAFVGLVCAGPVRDDADELKAVVVLFRHGDRSPLSSWPKDTYFGNASLWPDGSGQLNNLGKERHYQLGQWFRERYDGFLPTRYNRNDIYVQSTDVDRTLQSAASNLAGLYPPKSDQVWNENLLWQAIPIHTAPESDDPILTAEVPCPKHSSLLEDLLNSDQFKQWNSDLYDTYLNLSNVTGYTMEEMDISTFSGLFSTITIYRGLNFTLPSWTEEYWPLIKMWAARKFQWGTYTEQLARLRTGPFFDYLFNYFNSVRNHTLLPSRNTRGPRHQLTAIPDSPPPKFLMLSAHDTTIGDRTNAMGVYPDAVPQFGSTVIWELREGQNGYYVNMYFKNSTHFSEMSLPRCNFNCTLDEYQKVLEPITVNVEQWAQECNEI